MAATAIYLKRPYWFSVCVCAVSAVSVKRKKISWITINIWLLIHVAYAVKVFYSI